MEPRLQARLKSIPIVNERVPKLTFSTLQVHGTRLCCRIPYFAAPEESRLWNTLSAIGEPEAGGHNVQHGQRHEVAPAEAHQLVIAEAGQRAAHPDVEKQEAEDLEHEPEKRKRCV